MSKFDSRCPMKGSKLDVELANLIQTLSPYAVSWYRSYYDFHKDENDPFFDDMETEEQVNIITTLVQDLRAKDEFKKDCEVLGKSNKSRSYLYSLFAETIPSEHRLSIIEEVASEFTSYINRQIRDNSEYKNMSRVDVVSDLGVDNIFREVRDRLCKNRLKFADIIGDYLNDDNTLNEETLRANTNYETDNILAATKLYNKEQRARIEKAYKSFSIINNILETPGVWTATIFLSKQALLNTERVKLGHESEFSAFIDKLDDLAQEGESFEGVDSETNIEDAENETLEHWMLKADTISALSGISAEIRTFLNTVMVQDSKGILGFASRIDVGNAYLSLLKFRVESGASNSEDFIDYLNSKADEVAEYLEKQNETPDYYNAKLEALKNTGILYIMDTLEDKNNSESKNYDPRMYYMLKTLLFTNFNKACCNYTIVEYKTTDGHKCSTIEINLGDFNSISETVNAFQKSIKELELQDSSTTSTCVFNSNGRLIPTKINTVSGKIRDWLEFMKTNNYDKATKCDLIRELNNDILLDKFVDINIEDLIEDTEESNERFKEFLTNVRQLLGELAKNGGNVSILSKGSYKRVATALEELLKTETIYPKKRTLSFEGCTRFGDSTYFNNTNKFALSVKMEEIGSYLKSGDRDGLKQYLKEEYLNDPIFSNMSTKADSEELSIHHDWLEQLYNWSIGKAYNRDFIEVFKESTIIRGLGDKNGYKEWKEFNETENFRFTISHFMSSYIEHKGTMGLIPTFVLGDADSVRFIPTTVLDCSKAGNYKAKFIEILRQELIDIEQFNNLADYFAEHDITGVSIFTDRIGFSFFPALHEEYSKKSSPEARAEFVDAIRADLANGTSIDIFYDKWIKPSLDAQLENFITLMRGKEMADKDGNLSKSMFPENYTSRIFEYNGGINSANKSDLTALEIIFLNFKFGEIQHIRMSSVSPLFYAGTEDMQKRWKEIIASGNTLDLSATDASGRSVFTIKTFTGIPAQRVGYFKDFSVNTYETDAEWQTFLETVGLTEQSKELYGKGPNGRKSSVTDGQAYRSFESYRAIKIANGEWYKDPNNEKVFNIIMGARARGKAAIKAYKENNPNDAIPKDILEKGELTKDEWREIIDSKVIFQPIKPFYYGLEKVALENGIADIPVQHKYAEIVLIPELLPIGHTMRKLGSVMDEFAYDMLASTKCVKVGGFDYADIDIDTIINGDQETINKAFTREETVLDNDGNPIFDANNNPVTETIVRSHILGLNGYVMQTNVPYHGNTFRGEGTQVRKILGYTGTIEMAQEICKTLSEYGEIKISEDNIITTDAPMKGTDLQELFTALECAGWCKSIKDFTETVRDPKKLSRIIENSIANDSKSSNDLYNSISFVEEDGITRKIPLSEGIFSADIMAQLLSILRKRVVKQDTHGGTAVQIAPLGMDLKVHYVYEDGKPVNIDYVDGAISFDFTITNEYGKTIELDYLKYVDPRTGKLYADNGKDTVDDPENSMLAHEYPKILNFLMYRVPTERAYSTIAVKATRFFPKTMGGVVALPIQYTTIAGFDFDIDKLYYMLRSYIKTRNRDKFNDVEKGKIWNRVYSTHLDIKTALEEAFRKSKDYGTMGEQMLEKGMVYLNRYWSRAARRHPEIFEQYDKTELFNEALEELAKEGTISNYTVTLNGYDKNIPLMNQPEHIRNNIKMDYMWDRWGSASTVVERFTPGGFYNIEAETNLMKMISRNELREYDTLEKAQEAALEYKDSYMDPSDITTIIHYQTANTIYGRLIGIAANQNIHQKLLSMMDICSMVKYAKDGSPVANPIRFGSMISRATTDENIGVSLVERYKGTGANRIDSELNLAENLAAAVDAVKQATLEYFDITPFTFGMVALAVKVGATPQDIGLLFNQPVVKEAIRLMEKGERTFDTALKKAYAAMNDNKPYKSEEHIDVNLDSDTLYKAIYHYQGGYKYTDKAEGKVLRQQNSLLAVQSRVVDTILALSANTQDFKSFLNSGKATSSNSVGSDISSLEHLLYSVNKTMVEFGNASAGSRFNIKSKSGNKVFDLSLPLIVDGDINPELIDTLSKNEFGIETMVLYCFKEFLDSTKAEFPYRSDGYMAVKDAIATLGKDYNLGSKCGVPSAQILKLINQQLPTYLLGRYANFSDVNLEDFSSGENLEATREKIAENQTYLNDFKDAYEGEIIIFDVESTGIDPLIDDIAQLSAKRVVNGEVVEEFNVYLELKDKELPAELGEGKPNPLYELYKNGSISTTSRAEGLQDFLDFIGDAPLVGHNSDNYDVPILLANIKRDLDSNITSLPNSNKQFDTLKLDTIMHPDLSDHKLENLKYYLNFNNSGTSHLADSDVSDTVELAKVILGDFAKLGNKVPRKYVSNRRYFLAKFMRELSEAKQDPEINDYAIINMINLKQGRYGAYIEFEGLGRLQGEEKNAIIDSWVAMLNSPNERVSKLAKDLFIYDFHTKGLSAFGKNVANSVTPSDIKSSFADYIDFARKLNSLTVEDGNFILNGKSLGTVNEFITMLLINSINPNQSSNTHWEYIHTVTKDELDELLKDSRLKSILTDSSSDGESESDLEITIANPGRNTAFSGFFQSTWQDGNGVTVRQFYPILRIGKRVYYANSLTTINGETYSHVALETKDGNNSFVTMRYSLAIGNDSKNTRTHVSTVDFSDFSSEDRNIGGISDIEKDILPPESSSIEEATSGDSECVRKVAIGETVFVDKMRAAKVARDLSIALGLDREYINRLQDGNAADKQLYSDLMMIAAVAGYSNLSEGLGAFIGTRDRQRNPVYARVSDNAIAKAADIIANRMTVNSTTDVTISNAEALHQEAQEIARLQNLCY